MLAGRTKLAALLVGEDAQAVQRLKELVQAADVVTLLIDGWTSAANQSVYASALGLDGSCGRREAVFDAEDCSEDRHTGEWVAGKAWAPLSLFVVQCLLLKTKALSADYH